MDGTTREFSHMYCSKALSKGRGAEVLQKIETVQRLIHKHLFPEVLINGVYSSV